MVSGGVWWCLVVSGSVGVCKLVLPELIDVYGQIYLPVHVTDTADALLPSGSPFEGPGPHGDLFQFLGPHWVPISVLRSPFSLFRA